MSRCCLVLSRPREPSRVIADGKALCRPEAAFLSCIFLNAQDFHLCDTSSLSTPNRASVLKMFRRSDNSTHGSYFKQKRWIHSLSPSACNSIKRALYCSRFFVITSAFFPFVTASRWVGFPKRRFYLLLLTKRWKWLLQSRSQINRKLPVSTLCFYHHFFCH